MLKTLRISNYAIINSAAIQFSPSLNIITGETGAGKSILLGALGLLTGERADTKVLFNTDKKCIVEAVFEIQNYALQNFFETENIDYAEETIIRRELTANGKSRAFINDTPVTLNVLQQLADQLVTIHSQHETLALGNSRFQLTVVDALAGLSSSLSKYTSDFVAWKNTVKQLKEAELFAATAAAEKDFIEFQFNELDNARLEEIDQAEMENELAQLTHADEIKTNVFTTVDLLENAQGNIHDTLRQVISHLHAVVNYSSDLKQYADRLETSLIEIKDITRDLQVKAEDTVSDPKRAEEISQRLSTLFRLQKKYNCRTTAELIQQRETFNEKLFSFSGNEAAIEKLKLEESKLYASVSAQASKLSDKRKTIFPQLEKKVKHLLAQAGMRDAEFIVEHNFDLQHLNENGADSLTFLFSANKGSVPQDVKKVASGGELSRLMLCIKSLLASSTALPSLIFDEIDTGVSGETANRVGNILSDLAAQHQVIAITHLPQIAGKGDHHLFVYKTSGDQHTETHIKLLKKDERVQEIAKMLSGENPTKSALNNARELLQPGLRSD